MSSNCEVREMRNAVTVLNIIRDRGQRGLPVNNLYRLLYNRDLYLRAYAKLYPNKGALTPGVTDDTVDAMSLAKIDRIIAALRQERDRWTPVRRIYIPKRDGKRRGLGLPSWSDKLLQEVIRPIDHLLKAGYWEDWRYHRTLSGVPQGGVVSPILANLVLDRLDKYVEQVVQPAYTRGERRKTNPPYVALTKAAHFARKQGDWEAARHYNKQAQTIPSRDPNDPDFRRLWYVRYADDWVRHEARVEHDA